LRQRRSDANGAVNSGPDAEPESIADTFSVADSFTIALTLGSWRSQRCDHTESGAVE